MVAGTSTWTRASSGACAASGHRPFPRSSRWWRWARWPTRPSGRRTRTSGSTRNSAAAPPIRRSSQWALGIVPGVTLHAGNIGGTGITLGVAASEAFNWRAGVSAWPYIQQLDRATLYRTYQPHDGTIYRVQMIGHPNLTPEFTLANEDMLEGSTASRNTEQTRNAAAVRGHDYGDGAGPVLGTRARQQRLPGRRHRPGLATSRGVLERPDRGRQRRGWRARGLGRAQRPGHRRRHPERRQ